VENERRTALTSYTNFNEKRTNRLAEWDQSSICDYSLFIYLRSMKIIEFTNPHRKKHFEFFNSMNHPHFNLCGNVEITGFIDRVKKGKMSFTPAMAWTLSKAANDIPEFRQRIREDEVVEHKLVHPSFSVATEVADVFSFCEVKFSEEQADFLARAKTIIAEMRKNPSMEDDHSRDDYLFMSSIPWVSFTSMQHAMSYHPCDSVPRIVWGKHFLEGDKIMMPLSVQVHHAVVDGRHVGRYFERVNDLCM
jgi:chloramphenicol O-acetyltransferase type A